MTVDSPRLRLVLGLAPGVSVSWSGLRGPSGPTQLADRPLLDALATGASVEHLLSVGTPRAGRDVSGVLDVLHRRQLLAWQVVTDSGTTWATLTPLRREVPLPLPGDRRAEPTLSRFALMRPDADVWLVESGRSPMTATLSTQAASSVASGDMRPELIALLSMGRLLTQADDEGDARSWEFHDRYFASRSRPDGAPTGGTFRFAGDCDPEPFGWQPPHAATVVALSVPDTADPGPGLWSVVEHRTSHVTATPDALDLDQLGALLWHTLRVKEARPRDTSSPTSYDAALKPVPSAGATHSINLWLACRRVTGLDPGAWWYDADAHALIRTGDLPRQLADDDKPVHGILISRHSRLAWKYERIAHALALKDSGVILHALQLGATALGLAMCPLGSGPTAPVLEALGLSEDACVPVGEFWLARPHER